MSLESEIKLGSLDRGRIHYFPVVPGRVEFAADLEMLVPKDLAKANGALLYDVNNRGNRVCLGMFNGGGADGCVTSGA